MVEKIKLGSVEIYAPRQIVIEALKHVSSGSVLDIGSGFGRHSLFLADKGFVVTAIDTANEQLTVLRHKVSQLGLSMRVEKCDLRDFDSEDEQYDLILSLMVLHFLANRDEVLEAIQRMQEMTKVGGVNVVCAYIDKSQLDLRPYLLNSDELRKRYTGWDLLRYEELKGTDTNIDGPDKEKLIWRVEIIARKI
ncbi:MAG: methyltransferase domain-containing protein [Patescibacteria group bacterium]